MLPASNRGVGQHTGFPDTCNTPVGVATSPIPYPNLADNAQAAPFAATVMVSMVNGLNMTSMIPMTYGMEAGCAHPLLKLKHGYTMGNPKIFIEKTPAINLTAITNGNSMNCPSGAKLVPSVTNVFYTLRPDGAVEAAQAAQAAANHSAPLSADEQAHIAERTRRPAELAARLLEGGVGLIRIDLFTHDLPTAMFNALRELEAKGMSSLVIDLRGCPGGELGAMVQLAEDFLEGGSLIVSVVDADGDEMPYRARGAATYRFPLAVIIDGGTASAAELFAGALQAHGRTLVVGQPSHGKSCAQGIVQPKTGGDPVYATVATCRLADGRSLQGCGVVPDHPVSSADGPDEALAVAVHSVHPR